MSSPLLDKLAPDLRQRIYEYVLAFDAPLHHVARMRPFFDRIITYNGIPWSQFGFLGSESITASTNGHKPLASSSPVNTSLLVANKLVYTEAITAIYDTNATRFESQLSWLRIIPPHATDLSLAKHVICKIDMPQQEEGAYENALVTVQKGLPKFFHQLRSGTVYLFTNSARHPALALCSQKRLLGEHQSFTMCECKGVGSLVAQSHHAGIQLVVQCKAIINHWTEFPCDEAVVDSTGFPAIPSTRAMERYMVLNPDSALAEALMQKAIKAICTTLLPWGPSAASVY